MNKYEEAKGLLSYELRDLKEENFDGRSDSVIRCYETALEACEKHIAKKTEEPAFDMFNLSKTASCPSCDNYVTRADLYCGHCGQKLDWEVNNNE
jgi:hypothetical protein